MKNREVIEKILAYHPNLPDYHGCDEWKTGDPEAECTGIVTALVPTFNVIKKAVELGANLIIVHEPIFYTSADKGGWYEDFSNAVYEEKRKLIDDHGIAVWRDHDHMHAHHPDSIFTGVIKYLGWEKYATPDLNTGAFGHYIIDLPETVTVEQLCRHLMDRIGMNGVRYVGKPEDLVRSLAFVGHLYPMDFGMKHADGTPAEYSVQSDLPAEALYPVGRHGGYAAGHPPASGPKGRAEHHRQNCRHGLLRRRYAQRQLCHPF